MLFHLPFQAEKTVPQVTVRKGHVTPKEGLGLRPGKFSKHWVKSDRYEIISAISFAS